MKLNVSKEKRRFLLFLPLVAIPFLCLVFHVLGGGAGTVSKEVGKLGLNPQLPGFGLDLQKAFQNKLKTYEQADHDSLRKAQYQRQDPYRRDSVTMVDPRAGQLERQLARLRESLPPAVAVYHPAPVFPLRDREMGQKMADERVMDREADREKPSERAVDPQLDRLNAMLDKVIRIQHPQEQSAAATSGVSRPADEVLPADSNGDCIAAVVPEDQTLVTGETLTLRIIDPIRVRGVLLPAGELAYGTVTLNADRLLVHIGSLREDRALYATDWQVVDLDGLTGIHIPGLLGRDVAKQSADQGVNSLNVMTLDPSIGAQAAGAGIQAAKSFLGRKVRQVRVTIRAGYQVLLRKARPVSSLAARNAPVVARVDSAIGLPEWTAAGGMIVHCRGEGIELGLRELWIKDSCLWFGLEWRNRSPIAFSPAYMRWTVRDRRSFKRTALQEQPLTPCSQPALSVVGSDSVVHSFTGFRSFALPRDKELVVDVGEKGGGRALTLIISHSQILKARVYAKTSQ